MKRTISFTIVMVALAANLVGCKQGDPGPAGKNGINGTIGINGTNGTNGTNGSNGSNGSNGTGFDEAAKNGSILIYLDGTRADGVTFKDTLKFLFSPANLDFSQAVINSSVDTQFITERYLSLNYNGNDNYANISLDVNTQDSTTYAFTCQLNADISTSDYKYFSVNDYLFTSNGGDISNVSFTNFSYTSATGSLKYSFSFIIPSYNNETGNTLNVMGDVDAKVYEKISANNGRIRGQAYNQIGINFHR